MTRVSIYPVRTLMMSLAVLVLIQPLEVSAQERPAIAGRDDWRTDFTKHTVPFEEFASGGPPKDGIRSIDRPSFVTIREADGWLGPGSAGDRKTVSSGTARRVRPGIYPEWRRLVP